MSRLREWLLKILLRKEVQTMAVVYATLIVKGKKTLEQVPAKLREEVEDILEALEVKV
jgi:NADH dehydrogenase FAD-containing subunit|nr:CD1375 family protein [uncultured Oscillibacter sp.]